MDLQKYITNVKSLEILCYKQEQYINQLVQFIEKVKHPTLFNEHVKEKSNIGILTVDDILVYSFFAFIVGLVFGVVFYIAAHCIDFLYDIYQIYYDICSDLFGKGIEFFLANAFCFGILFAIIWLIILGPKIQKQQTELKAEDQRDLDEECETINADNRRKNKLILDNANKKLTILNQELNRANITYRCTKNILEKYYSKNIIFAKYRSIIPVCMFYEYIISGRCNRLDGHEGAYNLYEQELRMQIITNQLSEIIKRLDVIAENQYTLVTALRESKEEVQVLSNFVQKQTDVLRTCSKSFK